MVALFLILIDQFVTIEWLRVTLMLVVLAFYILILQFFRNPKRETPINPNHIISSVDGKVVVIEEVEENEYFKDKRRMVSVFMSPLNVHVTRYPMSGEVVYSKYHPGKYLVAWHPKASEENERTTVVVENTQFGKVLYRQIAGALAKRIVKLCQRRRSSSTRGRCWFYQVWLPSRHLPTPIGENQGYPWSESQRRDRHHSRGIVPLDERTNNRNSSASAHLVCCP